jgi:hypothetical protein
LTNAIKRNAGAIAESILERTPLVMAVLQLMENQVEVRGTPSHILRLLERYVDGPTKQSNDWPKTAARMTILMRRQFAPLLRDQGIEITSEREGHERKRIMTIRRLSAAAESKAPSECPGGEEQAP